MAVFVREGFRHTNDHAFLSLKFGIKENIFKLMMIGLGSATSKAFGRGALEIP